MARRRLRFLLPALVLACGPAAPPGEVAPLLDGLHAPLVLTESAALDHPPAYSGNRFLTGWRRWRRPEGIWQINEGERSTLETALLEARPRRLRLSLETGEVAPGATVGVRAAGRELTPPALVPALEIALPPDLPLGRVPIELDFGGVQLAVEAATLDGARRPGTVRFGDGAIVQSGYSIVDFPRRLGAATTLVGRFEPPRDPRPEQRFALVVETEESGAATVFEWRPGWLAGLLGGRDLRVPLPRGIVRLRLLAQGAGRPGHWQGLGLAAEAVHAPPPPAPPAAPRLIVLYVMDALRADAVGHLGGAPAASPVIDRLAAEGVTFERHYSVSPDTVGSTKALLIGVPVLTPEGRGVKLAAGELDTLGILFRGRGFRTGLFTGQPNVTSYGAADGFEEERFSWLENTDEVNRNAERVHADFLDWLDGLGEDERAFAMLQTIHPHNPYMPPEPFRSRFTAGIASEIDGSTKTLLDVHHGRRQTTAADRRRLAALYHANLAYNDQQLGLLVAELARRYAPGEVLFIITSDHGEELFEHDGVLHGFTLYEEQLRIPLVVWWPGRLDEAGGEPAELDEATRERLRALGYLD